MLATLAQADWSFDNLLWRGDFAVLLFAVDLPCCDRSCCFGFGGAAFVWKTVLIYAFYRKERHDEDRIGSYTVVFGSRAQASIGDPKKRTVSGFVKIF